MQLQASNCIPFGTTVTLTRQSEVDSFPINYPGCDVIEGTLTISGNDIVNLNGLISLKKVYWINIDNNPILINLKGLDSLNKVTYLDLNYNNNILNFIGLENLKYAYGIDVNNNSSIVNFIGFGKLAEVEYLRIENNSSLINFIGLDSLNTVTSLTIQSNSSIKNLYGFSINYISELSIYNNSSIINLEGIESLKTLNIFSISYNDSLLSLKGLDSIVVLSGLCTISNNNLLKNFNGLQNVIRFNSSLFIYSNPSLENFFGLNNVKYIYTLDLRFNNSLRNFSGINNLDSVNDLIIYRSSSLKNLEGLNNLKYIVGRFIISDNQSLCSINELNNSISIPKTYVSIDNNLILSCCKIMDTILNNNPTVTNINISNNATGCNNLTEIRTITTQNCCNTKYTTIKDTICSGEQIVFNSKILTTSGTYYDTVVSNGLDSITILLLTVRPKSYQIITKDYCIGQTFTLSNGKIITTTGTFKDTIPNICDSIIEYRLNFLSNITTNVIATICKGKNYTLPKGNLVSTTGIYRDTLRSAFNCDSIVVTNLTVTNPIPFNNNISICSGKSFTLPNGNIVNTSGIYIDTIRKINTCDSIIITNLTVTNPIPFNKNISICSGKSYTLPNGIIVKTSGIYIDTIRKINTCDTIIFTNLTVNPYLQFAQAATVCLGKSYVLPSGKNVNQPGVYKDTIQNIFGCDSIVTTTLTVTNPIPNNINITICEGKIYRLPNGKIVSNAGIYTDTIKKINTCDSIVITNLSVIPNTFSVSLNSIDSIDAGTSITLQPTYNNQTAISWNWTPSVNLSCTTCENPIATLSQNAQYIVKATAQNGCEDTAIATIFVRQLEIYVPAAFSPNSDNVNDEFTVFATNLNTFSLKIFNRYGELVFQTNDINTKWNGTYKGEDCAVESYNYIIDATQHNNKKIHKQGTVLLVR